MVNYLIKSKRIGLRLLEEDDAMLIFSLESDPLMRRYHHTDITSLEESAKLVKEVIRNYQLFGLPCFVIEELATKKQIGVVNFSHYNDQLIEVGYGLFRDYRGQGYATEALQIALQWARENMEEADIVGFAMLENKASSHVMEKCGMLFQKVGLVRGAACQFYQFHVP